MTGMQLNKRWGKETIGNKANALVHGLMELKQDNWCRVHNTGVIKHNRANMARVLFAQKSFLDTWPKLLILPIMTWEMVKQYKGGEYEIIVLAAGPDVYKQCGLREDMPLASYSELKTVCQTLQVFVKACAYVAVRESDDFADLPQRERELVSAGVSFFRKGVRMPRLLVTEDNMQSVRVGKAMFSMIHDEAHQECDPFALLLKGVAVESLMQGEKILPGCSPLHDCDDCLEKGLTECHCGLYDPEYAVPEEIAVLS